ncbi:MAG: hypothetical protein MJK04_00135 [Psychrosphaera sp.]|nr:hypothetical protein [Psychrosphaera sp.]
MNQVTCTPLSFISFKPRLRDTNEKNFKIEAEEMLGKHRTLMPTIEKLWCNNL